jgi:chromosome segregation ATPase
VHFSLLFFVDHIGIMNFDSILSTFPKEIRESTSMKGMVVLIQTLFEQLAKSQEQLQKTQEQLTKAQEKIIILEEELARYRKTPKRPKFRPNQMQPRNRQINSQSSDSDPPALARTD